MYLSNFDIGTLNDRTIKTGVKKLDKYRKHTNKVVETHNDKKSEYSLAHIENPNLHDTLDEVRKKFKGVKHLILVGIGGSNLGTEAIHSVLDKGKVELHTLDTVSPYKIEALLKKLKSIKSASKLAVCVISKSGGTAETLVNAGVLLEQLEKRFKKAIYKQTIFIGNPNTPFMKEGKRLKVMTVNMPEIVGGRYSVATEVGLVPLAILGHNTDAIISGVMDANSEQFESITAENAVRLHHYINKGYCHYNFFAFEMRLEKLGAWYRQLFAESIGKAKDKSKKD